MTVRVRFAPSPTGTIHIGNMRTAIFNWLTARHAGGAFLLRVEDTDRERSTPEAVQGLMAALEWLGVDFDEEPLFQSTRVDAHLAAAEELLSKGLAYKEDKGGTGQGECIVFRMPTDGDLTFEDEIKGTLRKPAEDVRDLVIVRSNGTPVFHLANVLDDVEMGITHVIRGDDHIENTYRHVALLRALGADVPRYAHLPMIVNAQGKPYSKRDGDAFVEDYQAKGYLPEALFNFLALLGWSPGDDREIVSREEMIALFDLGRVKSSPARMDADKLNWMNGEYINAMPAAELQARCRASLEAAGLVRDSDDEAYVARVIELMRERVRLFADFAPLAGFFFTDDYPYDEKAVKKRLLKEGALAGLATLGARLAALDEFTEATTEAALRACAEELGVGAGSLIHPIRVAVSGLPMGPGLFEMLDVLGRERVLQRIDATVARFG